MAIEDRRAKKYWTHGKPREKPWLYRDRANGVTIAFKTEAEAKEFQEENNSRKRRTGLGLPGTIKDLKKHTARDIIRSYRDSGLPENVFLALHSFSLRDICSLSLFDFNTQVAEQYRDDRLEELWKPPGSKGEAKPISPRTVRWEISHIQLAWKAAKKWEGLNHLENPWEGMRIKGSTGGRQKRGLQEGELERLIEACKGCLGDNRYYIPLAIYLVLDTGMRRQEVLNLTWEDIDFEKQRIRIRKSKTDWITGITEGVNTILTFNAEMLLLQLAWSLAHDGSLPGPERIQITKPGSVPKGRIFPMTGEAFTQAFRDVVRRAGLRNITFRSTLRTTANTGFIQATLTEKELDIMMRHTDKSTNAKFYTDRDAVLPQIQEKLERYRFGGKTIEETERELKDEWVSLIAEGIEGGLAKEDAIERATAVWKAKPEWVQIRAMVETIKTCPLN